MGADAITRINDNLGRIFLLGWALLAANAGVPIRDGRSGLDSDFRLPRPYLAFAPSIMGVVWIRLSDLTIFSVVALYFLK